MSLKQLKPPKEYGGERSQYREWRETLHAYLNAHDSQYVKLLIWLEELGRRPFRPDDLLDLASDLDYDADDIIEAKNS